MRSRSLSLAPVGALLSMAFTAACSRESDGASDRASSSVVPASAVPGPAVSSERVVAPKPSAVAEPPAKAPANGPLTVRREGKSLPAARARKVLHVGDSMVPLVGNYLRPRFEAEGGKYEIVSTSSSSTLSWAEGSLLHETLAKHDPELVLISLGSNELYFVDDLEQRALAIRAIVREVGDRACLWIGPPSWAKARGFLDTLEASLGPCSYFDSAKLPMDRQADGRHPTWGASHGWANQVWQRLGGATP